MRQNVMDDFYVRLGHCQAAEESQFEYQINYISFTHTHIRARAHTPST